VHTPRENERERGKERERKGKLGSIESLARTTKLWEESGAKLTKQTKTTRLLYTVSLSPCRCPKSSPTSATAIQVLLTVSCVPMMSRRLYSSADHSIERCACSSALGRLYWSRLSALGYSGVLALPLEDWLGLTCPGLLSRCDHAADCWPAPLPLFRPLSRAHMRH
jgi:hypothetical protein